MSNSNDCTFYIIRHAPTDLNLKGILQGHVDLPLIDEGIMQAKQWITDFKEITFDAVFSSDLLRAKQTAEIIALEKQLAVKTTELLRERKFGHYEGKPYTLFEIELKELVEKFEKLSFEEKRKHRYHPTMENDEEITARFLTFLRETALAYPRKTVLIVSHAVMISSLLIHLGFISYEDNPTYSFKHNAYFQLMSDGVDFTIKEARGVIKK